MITLEQYLAARRYWEVSGWILFLTIGFAANVGINWIEIDRSGADIEAWEPVVWQATSHLALGLLLPLILWFDRRFPIGKDNWRSSLAAHAGFTLVYSLAHVTLMYWGRIAIYALIGGNDGYRWQNWWAEFGYEYLKDFRTYFYLIAIIYLYRFVLRRAQGEAGYLAEGRDAEDTVELRDRLLIKKLGREFLVRVVDVDWIESSGNYVNLHVGKSVYPLRETMNGIQTRLEAHGFQRVHRSTIVNLDRIREIVMFDTGDGEVHLSTGTTVPVSRRYRKQFRDSLG